jgi:hypothetical protein
MARQRFRDTDPVEEILQIALKNQGGADLSLRERLLASASELGISEEAALAAQEQWQRERKEQAEAEEYRGHILRGLYTHAGIYVFINLFLVLLNLLTSHGHLSWAYYVILAYGIGMGAHLVATLVQLKSPGGDEFDSWRQARKEGRRVKSPGMTIGVHINSPKAVDENRDINQTQA